MSELLLLGVNGVLTTEQIKSLAGADLIVAGPHWQAQIALAAPTLVTRWQAITPLDAAIATIGATLAATGKVVVLASGDPLFFGIGKHLLARFPDVRTTILPALSSVQLACARWRISWDDARIISLHGRKLAHPGQLLRHEKTIVLTDKNNSPSRLAAVLLDYFSQIGEVELPQKIEMLVAEDLALPEEKITRLSLSAAMARRFSPLNVICLCLPDEFIQKPSFVFGLTEEDICHDAGMITKNEVRAAVLHALRLPETGIFWDIGGGSGSVSLEAARLAPDLAIYTIERQAARLAAIKENIRRYRCFSVIPVAGEAPAALTPLPDPDRVFIGGGGPALADIVAAVSRRLRPGGRLVLTGVSAHTIQSGPKIVARHGFTVRTTEIHVRRDGAGGRKVFNPITITIGEK